FSYSMELGLRLVDMPTMPFAYVGLKQCYPRHSELYCSIHFQFRGSDADSKIEYATRIVNLFQASVSSARGTAARESVERVAVVSCLLWYPETPSVNEPLRTPIGTQLLIAMAKREDVCRTVSIEDLAAQTEREALYLKGTVFGLSLLIYR